MTVEEQESRRIDTEPSSHQYGNERRTDDVYEDPNDPKSTELAKALAATGHLTEAEARAFVYGRFEHFPLVPHPSDSAEEFVQTIGFDDMAEFEDAMERGTKKIADAIWTYELIDTYRSP